MPCLSVNAQKQLSPARSSDTTVATLTTASVSLVKQSLLAGGLLLALSGISQAQADSMSDLIAQKSALAEVPVPSARISTRSTIARTPAATSNHRDSSNSKDSRSYPNVLRQSSRLLPAFLSASYDNVESKYLPLLSNAETKSARAAREVISTARTMALNERTIIQGGCWDYLNAVFNRAGVTRDTIHKGTYREGPYASSNEIQAGDWLYYINHGYNDIEHSGLFVGWVDQAANQALILSYAGENRREPARYRVYDLSHVYQIMRPIG